MIRFSTILTTVIILISGGLFGQKNWEASFSTGYLVNGNIQFVEGYVDIGDAPTFQFNLGTTDSRYREIEIEYKIVPNQELDFQPNQYLNNPPDAFRSDVTTHTVGFNGINYLSQNTMTRPYAIFGGYLAIFDFKDNDVKTKTSAAFRFGAGVKHYFNEKVGLKVQMSYNAPIQFRGTGIYAGIGTGGADVGLSLNGSVLYSQGDFLIGVIYKL